jgi:hypothetical protein
MLLVSAIILGWVGLSLLVTCLCVAARRGDEARETERPRLWLPPKPVPTRTRSA